MDNNKSNTEKKVFCFLEKKQFASDQTMLSLALLLLLSSGWGHNKVFKGAMFFFYRNLYVYDFLR